MSSLDLSNTFLLNNQKLSRNPNPKINQNDICLIMITTIEWDKSMEDTKVEWD